MHGPGRPQKRDIEKPYNNGVVLTEKQTRDEIKNFPLAKPYACKSFNTPSHTSQDEDYAGFDSDLADIFGDELM